MYVAPAARGRGLARRMLAHLEATAAAAGAEALVLETGIDAARGDRALQSSGYTPIPGFGYHRDAPESRCFGKLLDRWRPPAERPAPSGARRDPPGS